MEMSYFILKSENTSEYFLVGLKTTLLSFRINCIIFQVEYGQRATALTDTNPRPHAKYRREVSAVLPENLRLIPWGA